MLASTGLSIACKGGGNIDLTARVNPVPKPHKGRDYNVGMYFYQFYDNFETSKRYMESARKKSKTGNLHIALGHAAKSISCFKNAEETYEGIISSLLESKYQDEIDKIRRIGKTELPMLKDEIESLKILKRELLATLSPGKLAGVYTYETIYFPYLPDSGVPVDILEELRIRQRAAKALLERIVNPDSFYPFKEDSSNSIEQKKAGKQKNLSIGYEILLFESEWLLEHAVSDQNVQCVEIVDEIRASLPKIEKVYKEIGPLKVSRSANRTFAWLIKETRKKTKARIKKKMESIKITTK